MMRPVQVAYQTVQQIPAAAGRPFVSASKPSVFRLEVINVPQYLNGDEFRAQFLKLDGCVDAVVEKDDSRQYAAYFVDFNTQELAEKCILSFTQWKGWGPKGLAFRRIGFVFPNLSSLPSVDGGAQPAKHSQSSPSAPVKQGIVSSAYLSGGPLGPPGSMHLGADQTVPQHSLQGLPPQGGNVHAQPGTVMIRADGSLFVPGQGNALSQSLPPPSGVSPYPVQHSLQSQAGIPDSIPSMAPYPQKDAVSMSRKSDAESIQNAPAVNGIVSNSPAIQYVRLADGSLKAMMAITSNEMPQRVNMLDQHAQPSPVSQAVGNVQSSVMVNHNYPQGQPQHVQYSETASVLLTGPPGMPNRMPGGPQQPLGAVERNQGTSQVQYLSQPGPAISSAEVGTNGRPGGISAPPVDNMPTIDGPTELPANASQTLYVDDVPLDMQKRELCHIFRPFGGFKDLEAHLVLKMRILQEVRIVTKTTKEGRPYSFAFAQFENAECAAAALNCLNGYQYDPDNPELGAMQLKYARQERGKGGGPRGGYDDVRMQHRSRLMRGDPYDSNENSQSGRFRRQLPEQKRPRQH